LSKDVLDIFYENWDGDIVLSETSNFTNEEDFLKQAQNYVNKTRGYHVPVIKENIELVSIVVNDEGEWYSKMVAEENDFEGKEITVYKTDLDWESVHA
jgi:hypothetical protein